MPIEPKTDSLEVKAKLLGGFEDISARLSSLQMYEIKSAPDGVSLLQVESRDIQKKPFIFVLLTLGKDSVRADYTIAPDSSPKLRRLSVIKDMLGVLSLVTDLYSADDRELFQQADSSIGEVIDSMSQSYSTLFNSHDSLSNEYREIKRLNIELAASNKTLSVQASQLSEENKRIQDRLKELETYSDSALMSMIDDWIESHGNSIDINEFAANYKIVPTRAEQMLDKMVALGYIEIKS